MSKSAEKQPLRRTMAPNKQTQRGFVRLNPEWLEKQDAKEEKAQMSEETQSDIQALKDEVKKLKEEVESLKERVTDLENDVRSLL
jgi:polyhydroxyalkanoate synthesis regulator phasin